MRAVLKVKGLYLLLSLVCIVVAVGIFVDAVSDVAVVFGSKISWARISS